MTDLIYDYISSGVDMLLNGVILSAVVVLLYSTTLLNSYSAAQQATSERVNYYREYNKYDNTSNLSMADALSALTYYAGDVEVIIKINATTWFGYDNAKKKYYVANGATKSYFATVNDLKQNNVIMNNATSSFNSKVYEDLSNTASDYYQGGVITGITFTKQ